MSLVRTILLVGLRDDDASKIRTCLEGDHGCKVEMIPRCMNAMERVRKSTTSNPVHVIITEAKSTPMSGLALAHQFARQNWCIPIILISDGTNSEHVLASASPYYMNKAATGSIDLPELMRMVHMTLYHPAQTE